MAIHLGFSNIPPSSTLAIQPSKHSHRRLQKAHLATVSEDYPGGVDRHGSTGPLAGDPDLGFIDKHYRL
jgi:hypothetical protein